MTKAGSLFIIYVSEFTAKFIKLRDKYAPETLLVIMTIPNVEGGVFAQYSKVNGVLYIVFSPALHGIFTVTD